MKTSELHDDHIDYLIARINGMRPVLVANDAGERRCFVYSEEHIAGSVGYITDEPKKDFFGRRKPMPPTAWNFSPTRIAAHGHPFLESMKLVIAPNGSTHKWAVFAPDYSVAVQGDTILKAAMRVIAVIHFGEEIDLEDETPKIRPT